MHPPALGLGAVHHFFHGIHFPLQPTDFVDAVSEPASGSGLTGLPVGAPPVTSARLANRLATARAVLFFPGADTDAGLGFVLLVVLGTGP